MALHPHSTLSFFACVCVFVCVFNSNFGFFAAMPPLHLLLGDTPLSGRYKLMLFSHKHTINTHSSAVSPSDDVSGGLVKGFGWRLRMAK